MSASEEDAGWRSVHRIIIPADGVPEGAQELYMRVDGDHTMLDRNAVRLAAGARVSFGSYFGALPTVAWAAATSLTRVRLTVEVEGKIRVRVCATDAAGGVHELLTEDAVGSWSADIGLDGRSAGWLWFEAEAVGHAAALRDARWSVPSPVRSIETTASVAITTFDRNDDCIALLRRLASDAEVVARIVQVVVADQGNRRIQEHTGFAEAAALWGERLRVIEQDNLGGSGGFSRGMIEALNTTASHVLLLDDDVVLEPESVLRLLAMAEHTEGEPLIGAHMLRLTEPTRLHSWGERIDARRFWWEPVMPVLSGLDVAISSPARMPVMSAPCAVDFNGWWMCLVPITAVTRVGAALPLFIKWDDAEYGLRAGAAGHRTVTLPGAALWHVPWTAKDDGLDWQAYYQLRNRLVAALVHSRRRRGGTLLLEMLALDLNHIVCLQYGSAAVRRLAVQDVLSGPEHLVPTLRTRPALIREILADQEQTLRQLDAEMLVARAGAPVPPRGVGAKAGRLLRVLLHQLRVSDVGPGDDRSDPARSLGVDAVLRREDGKWWSLGLQDRVFLRSAADARGFLLRRDRRRAATGTIAALRSACMLWWRWPTLASRYRAAAPGLASRESWEGVFDAS